MKPRACGKQGLAGPLMDTIWSDKPLGNVGLRAHGFEGMGIDVYERVGSLAEDGGSLYLTSS